MKKRCALCGEELKETNVQCKIMLASPFLNDELEVCESCFNRTFNVNDEQNDLEGIS